MKRITLLLAALLCGTMLHAEIWMPALFGDNMVLQQESRVKLWGTAEAGKPVTVTCSWDGRARYRTQAGSDGRWSVELPTPSAGGPYTLSVSDGQERVFNNVMIGEVWLCSGQSNMEMPMKGFKGQPTENSLHAIATSRNPELRLFTVKRTSTIEVQNDVSGAWKEAAPASVREFSATAYYFGRMLQEQLGVPVGLIVTSWGGSCIEAWMSREMLAGFDEVRLPQSPADIKEPNRTPTTLYNAMVAPLVGYGIKGCIWYQGETNKDHPVQYVGLFTRMIERWRAAWGYEFPFYYCQIAPYDWSLIDQAVPSSAYLREAQLKVSQQVPGVGMAVLMDAGLERGIHPEKKREAGERLAYQAMAKTYGIEGIVADGPRYEKMEIKGDTIVLDFANAKMWLYARDGRLRHFTVAGADRKFHPAKAWIYRTKVFVTSEAVKQPVAARYAFENWVEGDLFGAEGLPVSSFRTDNWEIE